MKKKRSKMGRPKLPKGLHRVRLATSVKPETLAIVEEKAKATGSMGAVIDQWAEQEK